MVLSSVQVVGLAVASRARVVHLHDPELAWAVPVMKLLGRDVVFDAHEDLVDQVTTKPYLHPLAVPVVRRVARLVVALEATATRVVAATETIASSYPADRTVVVRNFPRLRVAEHAARPLGDRSPSVVYVGALNADRGAAVISALTRSPEFPAGWRLDLAGHVSSPERRDLTMRPRSDG
jgi:hypothetical protein